MGIARKIHHRESSPNPDLRTHPTYLCRSLRTSHDGTVVKAYAHTIVAPVIDYWKQTIESKKGDQLE